MSICSSLAPILDSIPLLTQADSRCGWCGYGSQKCIDRNANGTAPDPVLGITCSPYWTQPGNCRCQVGMRRFVLDKTKERFRVKVPLVALRRLGRKGIREALCLLFFPLPSWPDSRLFHAVLSPLPFVPLGCPHETGPYGTTCAQCLADPLCGWCQVCYQQTNQTNPTNPPPAPDLAEQP